ATEAPVEIEHWVTKGHVVELWDHVVTNPCKANCNITRAILRDTQTMQNIAFLHAWHRWVVASALPSFHNLFHATFEREPTWDFLANAFDSHAQVLATLPHQIGASLCEVEIALSAFEILLATQLTPYFFNESWLVCATKHPVVWLPIHNKANMVGPDTLWGLLHSFIGHELVADMRMAHPCGVFDTLARLQSLGYSYDKGTMVGFVPGTVPGLAFVTPYRMLGPSTILNRPSHIPPTHQALQLNTQRHTRSQTQPRQLIDLSNVITTEISILTANINGFKDNGHRLIQQLLARHTIISLQETKLADKFQYEKVCFHLDHTLGVGNYFLATNDHRTDVLTVEPSRSSGVMMLFQKDLPGFDNLMHLRSKDIRDKYMVVRTTWASTPVYFHNVYAPVHNAAREDFFESLPRNFPPSAIHIVMGDFNIPMDRELDAMDAEGNHHVGRRECMTWLQALGVIDAWRLHHPNARMYSSPRGKNRLDYIFLNERLVQTAYR
ncbi:hypothetical protein As57867_005434, partial [Aphanomyces stellatus]